MRRRLALWLVCLLAAALPLQSMAAVARMACAAAGAPSALAATRVHLAHAAGHVHDANHVPESPSADAHGHDAACSACAACCVATAPASPALPLAAVPVPLGLFLESALPEPALQAGRHERPLRPAFG